MQSLNSFEISKLCAGIPNLQQFGPDLLIEFEVGKLSDASVLWLNTRWFAQRGLPIGSDALLRSRVVAWVLQEFAFTTSAVNGARSEHKRIVHADRYGDAGGTSPHGGSGRVATIGHFQVKGIGPTPLVGEATWIHSHGCVSQTEAICEAVYGELLDQELPFGAVPVIAIIDTGKTFQTPQGMVSRALVVRPAVFRPAHLLRAPLFVPSSAAAFAPSRDASRSRESISRLSTLDEHTRLEQRIPSTIVELFERLATQAASADALRFFTGGLFAGNVSMDGAILDFGVARTLYSWTSLQVHAHAKGFGGDIERLAKCAATMRFYAHKAGCSDSPWFASEIKPEFIQGTYREALRAVFGRIWSDSLLDARSSEKVRDLTERYFELQQRLTLRERWDGKRPRVSWIYDVLKEQASLDVPPSAMPEWEFARAARDAIRAGSENARITSHCWRNAARILRPREELDRSRLERRIARILRDASPLDRVERVSRLVDGTMGRCRRWWSNLPPTVSVLSQRVLDGCSALEVLDATTGTRGWWLEGWISENQCLWGRSTLSRDEVSIVQPDNKESRWCARLQSGDLADELVSRLSKQPQARYDGPPVWWINAH